MDFLFLVGLCLFCVSIETGVFDVIWQGVPFYLKCYFARDLAFGIGYFFWSALMFVTGIMTRVIINLSQGRPSHRLHFVMLINKLCPVFMLSFLMDTFNGWNLKFPVSDKIYFIKAAYIIGTLLFSHLLAVQNRFEYNWKIDIFLIIQSCNHMYIIESYEGPAVQAEPHGPFAVPIYPRCANPLPNSGANLVKYIFTTGIDECDFPPCLN